MMRLRDITFLGQALWGFGMSDDEIVVLLLSLVVAFPIWLGWYVRLRAVSAFVAREERREPLYFTPIACAIILFIILRIGASSDVRDSTIYLTFYEVMGAAWVGMSLLLIPLYGLNARDDGLERHNSAAIVAIDGALVGLTLCFAGGNIGEGPGWWVVVFSALLATAGWLLAWSILEVGTKISDTITVDRDPAAGVRLAGFLVATGVIMGRAVAGNWVSVSGTLIDFVHDGAPLLILVLVAFGIERVTHPTIQEPHAPLLAAGWLPFVVEVGGALGYVLWNHP